MAVYSLFCLSPCALLQFGVFSDVWYLPHVVECLGRTKKREAGVEAMFQEFVSFMSGSLILCLMGYVFFYLFCVLIHVMCVAQMVVGSIRCLSFQCLF